MNCGAVNGDGVACTLSADPHRDHLAVKHVNHQPVYIEWPNESFVDPREARQQAAEQAQKARQTVKDAAATMRGIERRLARSEDSTTAKDAATAYVAARAHKTRLGKVAKYLIDNVGLWIDAVDFTDSEVGGFAGTRRLRELREEYGWKIETRRKPGSATAWQHRLTELPPPE